MSLTIVSISTIPQNDATSILRLECKVDYGHMSQPLHDRNGLNATGEMSALLPRLLLLCEALTVLCHLSDNVGHVSDSIAMIE